MEEHRSAEFNKDDDEEFYEKIEAPKYVDFTVPDPPLPDDRSWFCLRVGCDQKHEEDMDPDALYRSFVLRVMAARSPNIKLQKAMSRIAPHANIKCPQSAPAKSSKNRISRITAIALASQKMADKPIKSHPISRLDSASNAKAKQSSVAAKALTTPRPKRCLPGPDPLRSVQNPKTSVSLTKNRVVSKALIFHTPKKNERVKTSLHSHNPVTELCEQVKKLEINKQKQGRSRVVSSRYNNSNNVPTSNTSKAHLRPRKLRIQAEVSFISQGSKDGKVAKSSRCLKSKTKSNLPICNQSLSHERIDDDNSDMEIDGKSRDGSLEASSGSGSSGNDEKTGHDKPLMIVKALENLGATSTQDEKTPIGENPLASSSNVADLISNTEDGGSNYEEKKDLEVGVPKHQTPNAAGVENYTTGSDDKENALLSDDNREININNSHSKTKTLSKHEAHERSQKVIRELSKRDCSTAAATAQKYKKTKPTNPKPFRLRTDERGILKEANLDRRLHLLAPSKENPAVQRLSTGRLQRRHLTETQKTEKSHEGNQTESGKRVKKQQLKNVYLKTPKCATETKVVSTIRKSQKWDDGKERAGKKAECSLKKAKSPFPRPQLVKPQRMASASKATVPLASTSQLSTKKETSSAISRPRDVVEPTDNGNKNTISKVKAIRSCSRGKRPATIPKEPNFQSIHVPKSCTKKLSQAIMS